MQTWFDHQILSSLALSNSKKWKDRHKLVKKMTNRKGRYKWLKNPSSTNKDFCHKTKTNHLNRTIRILLIIVKSTQTQGKIVI